MKLSDSILVACDLVLKLFQLIFCSLDGANLLFAFFFSGCHIFVEQISFSFLLLDLLSILVHRFLLYFVQLCHSLQLSLYFFLLFVVLQLYFLDLLYFSYFYLKLSLILFVVGLYFFYFSQNGIKFSLLILLFVSFISFRCFIPLILLLQSLIKLVLCTDFLLFGLDNLLRFLKLILDSLIFFLNGLHLILFLINLIFLL